MNCLRGSLLIVLSLFLTLPSVAQDVAERPVLVAQEKPGDSQPTETSAEEAEPSKSEKPKSDKATEAQPPAEASVKATTIEAKPKTPLKKGYFGSVKADNLEIAADLDQVSSDKNKHKIRLEFYGNGRLRCVKSLSRDEWKAVVAAYHKASVRCTQLKAGQRSFVASKSDIIIHAVGTDKEDDDKAGGLVKMYLYDKRAPGAIVLSKPEREQFIQVVDRTNKYYGLATVTGKRVPLPKPPYKVYQR